MSGPKNRLTDLNNHLFEQLERLNNDELTGDELSEEIRRSRAVTGVASHIIQNGELVLKAYKAHEDRMDAEKKLPKMLGDSGNEKV